MRRTQLHIDTHPSNAFAANTFTTILYVMDQYGNVVTTDTSAVTVSLNEGGATLNGTVTRNFSNGQVIFNNLSMTKAGDYTLHFADGSLTAANSNQFTIMPAGADHLSTLLARPPRSPARRSPVSPCRYLIFMAMSQHLIRVTWGL